MIFEVDILSWFQYCLFLEDNNLRERMLVIYFDMRILALKFRIHKLVDKLHGLGDGAVESQCSMWPIGMDGYEIKSDMYFVT